MSITNWPEKIKVKGEWVVIGAIVLGLVLVVGLGQLWGVYSSRPPVKITTPEISQSNQATNTTQSQQTVKPAGKSTGKYVGSKNGRKYHLATCASAARIKDENKVWFDSKEQAAAAGYAPAANCPGI